MLRLCAVALGIFGMFISLQAYAQGSLLQLSPAQIKQFQVRLDLTAEQKPRAVAIRQRTVQESEVIFRKHGIIGSGKRPGLSQLLSLRSEMKAVTRRARRQMSQILKPVQLREYDAIMAEQSARIRRHLLQ